MEKEILENIHRLLVKIRYNIYDETNIVLLDIIGETLNNNYSNKEMINLLRQRLNNWSYLLKLQETFNSDNVNSELSDNELDLFRKVLNYSISKAKFYLVEQKYDIAYDIIDAIHIFPEIIVRSNKRTLKKFWKLYIEPVYLKWNKAIFDEIKNYLL